MKVWSRQLVREVYHWSLHWYNKYILNQRRTHVVGAVMASGQLKVDLQTTDRRRFDVSWINSNLQTQQNLVIKRTKICHIAIELPVMSLRHIRDTSRTNFWMTPCTGMAYNCNTKRLERCQIHQSQGNSISLVLHRLTIDFWFASHVPQ